MSSTTPRPDPANTSLMRSSPLVMAIGPLLANTIREELSQKEGLLGFPKDIFWFGVRGRPDRGRILLKAMSLVHREWTKPALDVLRRRVFFSERPFQNDNTSLQRFLENPQCRPWIREIQLWIRPASTRDKEGEDEKAALLSQLFAKLPHLVAISFGCNNYTSHTLSFSRFLGCLPASSRLLALHIQCPLDTSNLTRICEVIANSRALDTVSIIGICPASKRSTQLEKVQLPSAHPPASLKRFFLRVEFHAKPSLDIFAWLLQARGGYALQELRLNVTNSPANKDWEEVGHVLFGSLSKTLPSLKTLLLGDDFAYDVDFYNNVSQRCTSLKDLHLFAFPPFAYPKSVEHICWGHDIFEPPESIVFEDKILSKQLKVELKSGRAPNLRAVRLLSLADVGGPDAYPKTKKICEEYGIQLLSGCVLEGTWRRPQF